MKKLIYLLLIIHSSNFAFAQGSNFEGASGSATPYVGNGQKTITTCGITSIKMLLSTNFTLSNSEERIELKLCKRGNVPNGFTPIHAFTTSTPTSNGSSLTLSYSIVISANSISYHDNVFGLDYTQNTSINADGNYFNQNIFTPASGGGTTDFSNDVVFNVVGNEPNFSINNDLANRVPILAGCNSGAVYIKNETNGCFMHNLFLSVREVNDKLQIITSSTAYERALTSGEVSDYNTTNNGLNILRFTSPNNQAANAIFVTSKYYMIALTNTAGGGWQTTYKFVQYKAGSWDLVLKDYPEDNGFEPSGDQWGMKNVYQSPYLWNKRSNSTTGPTTPDNPDYINSPSNYNQMFVSIMNIGCVASPADGTNTLRLFWTRARTNEKWSKDWKLDTRELPVGNSIYWGTPVSGQVPLGAEITAQNVNWSNKVGDLDPNTGITNISQPIILPSISPGPPYTLNTTNAPKWFPPSPDFFDATNGQMAQGTNRPVICFLARLNEAGVTNDPISYEPTTGNTPIFDYVTKNNNVSTRNASLVDDPTFLTGDGRGGWNYGTMTVAIDAAHSDPSPATRKRNICIELINSEMGGDFTEYGTINLVTTNDLWSAWAVNSFQNLNIEVGNLEAGNPDEILLTDGTKACLNDIDMPSSFTAEQLGVKFNFPESVVSHLPGETKKMVYNIYVESTDTLDPEYVSSNSVLTINIPTEQPRLGKTSGIKNRQKLQSNLSVYPVPSNNTLFISNTLQADNSSLMIFDAVGKCVYSNIQKMDKTIEINTSQWREGIYFVKYQNETTEINKKVIILH